MSVLTRCLLWS